MLQFGLSDVRTSAKQARPVADRNRSVRAGSPLAPGGGLGDLGWGKSRKRRQLLERGLARVRQRLQAGGGGAEHRLGRTFGQRFGDAVYAFEELVAEIGSAAIGLRIGLRPQILDSHAAYLGHWVRLLKDRPGALLEASGHAQRAVDHLLAYGQPAEAGQALAA